jgi:cyclophilin family peptidyl-prolyl cis-trans isomerase
MNHLLAVAQIFFLLKESELTPSGANLLDGRYAVFGYAVNGQDNLGLMKVGSAAVIKPSVAAGWVAAFCGACPRSVMQLLPGSSCV